MKKDNIKLNGYYGTWYIIDTFVKYGKTYYTLENEQFGDEASGICITIENGENKVICDEFYDFETLIQYLEENH